MVWINIKGHFATDNPDLFLHNLKLLMEQTKTIFSGQITQQLIQDIPCEVIKVEPEKSEPTEVVKETESSENTDDSVNEEVTEQLSPEMEK
jgi:hypothetical protein